MTRGFNFLALVSAILLISSCVTTKLPETYQVDPEVLEAKGGAVEFTVKGTIPEKSFHKKAVVEFTPVLNYDGKSKELKKFVLRGEKTEGEGTVINSKTGGSFTYNEKFDYEDDMRVSELFVDATITKGSKVVEVNDEKLADGVIETYKNVVHDETTLYAPSGYERVTILSESATIYFRVNMSNLNTNLPLNKTEEAKAKMENLHNFILKGWEIQDISVDGWASPEGEIDFNDNLANDRAETTQKYMEKHMAKMNKKRAKELGVNVSELEQEVKYNIKGNGEDWDGFLMAVKNSDLKDKSMILNVINSQPDVNKREEEMRNMTIIYKEIEDNILPPLRRADLTVNCFEPKRTDEEIAKLATSSPDSLSYKEILHAATLTEDHEARLNIYKAAFTNKDRDWKAYNNAAVEAVALKKYDDAANFLAQAEKLASKNGKIENNLGVLACHNEDYEVAEQHFMKAMSYGENENYNLGVISIQKGEYAKALNYFKGIDCKHNVALAQLLSDNMDAALKNFKCAPESGKTYYMLAVYGARTNNAEMVYENLGKSIQKCGEKLKGKAKTDREFIKYFDEPNFKSLVE